MLHFKSNSQDICNVNSCLTNISCTLIAAPAGACHLAHSGGAALEKGATIPCKLRLAVTQMKNSHSQPLYVTLH